MNLFLLNEPVEQTSVKKLTARVVSIMVFLLELLVAGAQNSIKLFDKGLELLPILFHRDQRAQLMNAVTLVLVHCVSARLPHLPSRVCSMSNTAFD